MSTTIVFFCHLTDLFLWNYSKLGWRICILLQCNIYNQHFVSSLVRSFHLNVAMEVAANQADQKDSSLTLCTQANGIRTVTLNYAEKR